jgi:hypothetical protein
LIASRAASADHPQHRLDPVAHTPMPLFRSLQRQPWLTALLCGVATWLLYAVSLMPTVGFIDAPRYAAFVAHFHLGVASIEHPLFVIAAKPFTWLPWGDLAWRVNLATAFYGALAVALTALLVQRRTGSLYAAMVAALAFATSYDLWWLATEAEVYTLATALLLAALVALIGRPAGRGPAVGWAAFLLGLATVNHQAAIFALPPGIGYLAAITPRRDWGRALGRATLAFLLGVSPYLLLFAWRVVSDGWGETLHAAAGGEFQSSFLAPIGWRGYGRVLAFLVVITGYQFYPFHTAAWVVGLWRGLRGGGARRQGRGTDGAGEALRRRQQARLLLGIAALNALFVVLYDVPDRIYFYLPSFAMLALFLGDGLALLQERARGWRPAWRWGVLIFMTLPVCGKMVHYRVAADFVRVFMGGEEKLFAEIEARASGEYPILLPRIPGRDDLGYYTNPDKKRVDAAHHYAEVLAAAPAGALLIDDWYHGYAIMADYYQGVEGMRPDLEVVRWFQRWGGTAAEREALAARIMDEIEAGRAVLLASSQYPSSLLVERVEAAGHRLLPWAGIEDLWRVERAAAKARKPSGS